MDHDSRAIERVRGEFTQQASAMAGARTFNAERAIEPFVRLLGSPPPSPVLDLACGPGIVSAALARAGARVVGVDVTPAMLERARTACETEGLTEVEFHEAAAERLPFGDETFGGAVTRLSLHHFADPGAALLEVRRTLRAGAAFVVGDIIASPEPAEAALHDALEILRDPSHQRLLPAAELEAIVESAGFRIDAREGWANTKTFDEWAAIVADARSIEPVRVIMRELALAGRHAGIDLEFAGETVRFTHYWSFLAATAC
jgi:ubiquinone/menaquinone biosynthesis C-methylase UbiE